MSDELPSAVQLAMLERDHRRAVQDIMLSDMGDVERVTKVLALEAEYLGLMEKLRAARAASPSRPQDDSNDSRSD